MEYITFFPETFAAVKRYSPADRALLYEAMGEYAFSGAEPDWPDDDIKWFVWDSLKQRVDTAREASERKREYGRMGGRPKASESTDNQTKADESRAKQTKADESRRKLAKADESKKSSEAEADTEADTEAETERDNVRAREDAFDRFWSAYPRHTAKQTALAAFKKLHPDEALMQTILTAIERQKASPQWTKDGGQFVPHPATWLNQRRWEDEPPKATSNSGRVMPAQQYSQRDYSGADDALPDWVIQKGREMGILGGGTG